MSATAIAGKRPRRSEVSLAAASELPPSWKKSLSIVIGTGPSCCTHRCASQPAVPVSSSDAPPAGGAATGGGHGRALRSTLPEALIGSSSSTTIIGTIPSARRSESVRPDIHRIDVADDVPDQHRVAGGSLPNRSGGRPDARYRR